MSVIEINQCHFIYSLWMYYNNVKYLLKSVIKSVPELMPHLVELTILHSVTSTIYIPSVSHGNLSDDLWYLQCLYLPHDLYLLTVPELKKRWRGIRDYYRALKAARSPPSGSAAVPLTPLQNQYMRYLSFLDPVLQPKP